MGLIEPSVVHSEVIGDDFSFFVLYGALNESVDLETIKVVELVKTSQTKESIEEELKNLQLDADTNNRKKYLRKKLNKFSTFLKDKFSLIPEGHYSQMGLALGMTFGVALGLSIGNSLEIDNGMTYGLVFGMIFGLAFGKQKDSKAEKQNLVMKTNKKKQ